MKNVYMTAMFFVFTQSTYYYQVASKVVPTRENS